MSRSISASARFDAFAEEHRALARNLLEGIAKALARRLRHTNTEMRAAEE